MTMMMIMMMTIMMMTLMMMMVMTVMGENFRYSTIDRSSSSNGRNILISFIKGLPGARVRQLIVSGMANASSLVSPVRANNSSLYRKLPAAMLYY